jgi:Tfp pilus assembly protein PilN
MSVSIDPAPAAAALMSLESQLSLIKNADLYAARLDELKAEQAKLDAKLRQTVDLEALQERERAAEQTIAAATQARDKYVGLLDRLREAAGGGLDAAVDRARAAALAEPLLH